MELKKLLEKLEIEQAEDLHVNLIAIRNNSETVESYDELTKWIQEIADYLE